MTPFERGSDIAPPYPPSSLAGRNRPTRRPLPAGALRLDQVALPLAGRDRAAWRVASILLCLSSCRGKSASLEQLHVLSWALRDEQNGRALVQLWNNTAGAPRTLRAWDPSLDDTLRLAQASGLITQKDNGRQMLTERGGQFVAAIRDQAEDLMAAEQHLIVSLGQITEAGMWRRLGDRAPLRRPIASGT